MHSGGYNIAFFRQAKALWKHWMSLFNDIVLHENNPAKFVKRLTIINTTHSCRGFVNKSIASDLRITQI